MNVKYLAIAVLVSLTGTSSFASIDCGMLTDEPMMALVCVDRNLTDSSYSPLGEALCSCPNIDEMKKRALNTAVAHYGREKNFKAPIVNNYFGSSKRKARGSSNEEVVTASKGSAQSNIEVSESVKEIRDTITEADIKHYQLLQEEQLAAFRQSRKFSEFSFWVVHLIMLAGVFVSGLEFLASVRLNKEIPKDSELSIEAAKLSVKSASIGLIILVVSLAFYYLALTHVYPLDFVPIKA